MEMERTWSRCGTAAEDGLDGDGDLLLHLFGGP